MQPNSLSEQIYRELLSIPVIDTHEHLSWNEAASYGENDDVLREYLIHYMRSDVVSAGLKQRQLDQVIDPKQPIAERWRIVEPYWEAARYTGYGRALDLSAEAIYGVPIINARTIEELNEKFLAQRKPGHYARVLKELCHIETSLLDNWEPRPATEGEADLFKRIWQPQNYFAPYESDVSDVIAGAERRYGIHVRDLDGWLQALEADLDDILSLCGVRILKTAIAYSRSLRFESVEYAKAKDLFADALKTMDTADEEKRNSIEFPTELQDFMMHSILKLANARNLTIQIHTGLLEGNGNTLSNSDPSLLNNLFLLYPDVDFDLFHISYPYQGIACALAKMFPNVTIDMCWAHIISPAASVAALDDFLDAIPYNKISAFGGDYVFVDGVYGHLELSRRDIAETLARKVERGIFSEEKAVDIARALYYDNPKRIFKL